LEYDVSKLAPKVMYDIPYLWNDSASSIDNTVEFEYRDEAEKYRIGEYRNVEQSSLEMKAALVSEKAPLLFAVPVYGSSPYKERMWDYKKYDTMAGGHAMAIVGWDDDFVPYEGCAPGAFKVRNSWGTSWGDGGYTWFPYEDLKTRREADIENASEYPNEGYAQPMPWEIYAVIDIKEVIPDPEPLPIDDDLGVTKLPWWVWVVVAGTVVLPIVFGLLMSLVN
jgi:C1A family cysteine protease